MRFILWCTVCSRNSNRQQVRHEGVNLSLTFVFPGTGRIISDCVWQHGLFFGTAASALGADYEHCCALYEDWPLVWLLSWVDASADANLASCISHSPVRWQHWRRYQLCTPCSTPIQLPSCGCCPIPYLVGTEMLRGTNARRGWRTLTPPRY